MSTGAPSDGKKRIVAMTRERLVLYPTNNNTCRGLSHNLRNAGAHRCARFALIAGFGRSWRSAHEEHGPDEGAIPGDHRARAWRRSRWASAKNNRGERNASSVLS